MGVLGQHGYWNCPSTSDLGEGGPESYVELEVE